MTIDDISTPHSLRIAVIGMGGIGSTFAFQLANTGRHDVTVIARPGSARLRQLESANGILNVKGERADVRVISTLDAETPYDLVVVTLLAHQVETILPDLQRSSAKSIVFVFNNFEPERLRDAIGADRCAFGMPFVQAHLDGDGKLNAVIGAAGQKTKLSERRWVELFKAAGLPAVFEPDMMLWLRCHVPLCIAFESVSIAGVRRGGGASWSEALVLARGVHESFALIRGLGYEIYPPARFGSAEVRPGWWRVCCGPCRVSNLSGNCSRPARANVAHWSIPWRRRHLALNHPSMWPEFWQSSRWKNSERETSIPARNSG